MQRGVAANFAHHQASLTSTWPVFLQAAWCTHPLHPIGTCPLERHIVALEVRLVHGVPGLPHACRTYSTRSVDASSHPDREDASFRALAGAPADGGLFGIPIFPRSTSTSARTSLYVPWSLGPIPATMETKVRLVVRSPPNRVWHPEPAPSPFGTVSGTAALPSPTLVLPPSIDLPDRHGAMEHA